MTILDLLDKIDDTAPRCCQTCVHAATHFGCEGCLNGQKSSEFLYLNWQPGNWLRAQHQAQLEGRRNIVIGGQGEADISALSSPQEVSNHLHYVAGECGYSCGWLRTTRTFHPEYGAAVAETRLALRTSEGEFELLWIEGVLQSICDVNNPDGWRWLRTSPI